MKSRRRRCAGVKVGAKDRNTRDREGGAKGIEEQGNGRSAETRTRREDSKKRLAEGIEQTEN